MEHIDFESLTEAETIALVREALDNLVDDDVCELFVDWAKQRTDEEGAICDLILALGELI